MDRTKLASRLEKVSGMRKTIAAVEKRFISRGMDPTRAKFKAYNTPFYGPKALLHIKSLNKSTRKMPKQKVTSSDPKSVANIKMDKAIEDANKAMYPKRRGMDKMGKDKRLSPLKEMNPFIRSTGDFSEVRAGGAIGGGIGAAIGKKIKGWKGALTGAAYGAAVGAVAPAIKGYK